LRGRVHGLFLARSAVALADSGTRLTVPEVPHNATLFCKTLGPQAAFAIHRQAFQAL